MTDIASNLDKVIEKLDGMTSEVVPKTYGTDIASKVDHIAKQLDYVQADGESLADLTDVDVSNPTDGDTLVYDDTNEKWIAQAGGGSASNIVVHYVQIGTNNYKTDDIEYEQLMQLCKDGVNVVAMIDKKVFHLSSYDDTENVITFDNFDVDYLNHTITVKTLNAKEGYASNVQSLTISE